MGAMSSRLCWFVEGAKNLLQCVVLVEGVRNFKGVLVEGVRNFKLF